MMYESKPQRISHSGKMINSKHSWSLRASGQIHIVKGCKTTASKMLKHLEAAEKIEQYGRMDTRIKILTRTQS